MGFWRVERTLPDKTLNVVTGRRGQREMLVVSCWPDSLHYLLININAVHGVRVEPLRDRPGLPDAAFVEGEYRFDKGLPIEALFSIDEISAGSGGYRIHLYDTPAMAFIEGLRSAQSSVDISLEGGPSFKFDITPEGQELLSSYLSHPCPWAERPVPPIHT